MFEEWWKNPRGPSEELGSSVAAAMGSCSYLLREQPSAATRSASVCGRGIWSCTRAQGMSDRGLWLMD